MHTHTYTIHTDTHTHTLSLSLSLYHSLCLSVRRVAISLAPLALRSEETLSGKPAGEALASALAKGGGVLILILIGWVGALSERSLVKRRLGRYKRGAAEHQPIVEADEGRLTVGHLPRLVGLGLDGVAVGGESLQTRMCQAWA